MLLLINAPTLYDNEILNSDNALSYIDIIYSRLNNQIEFYPIEANDIVDFVTKK
jgi:hypothetical protein